MFKLTPVTSKIGQGHPSSNLTKTLLRYIHDISLGPTRLIFVKLSCLQAKIAIFMFKLTPVTSKIGQGHPSSNLTKTLLRYIHGISLGPMRLIFVKLSCLQAKIAIFMFKLTPVTSKIGQGHPSSNLTKTLLRYIHGISLGPMRLIFVKLSCLQAKIANFHV